MTEAPARAQLAAAIADAALLRGTFTLRSGRTSRYYLDKYLFSTRPEVLRPIAAMLAERVRVIERAMGVKADRLAGAELGGIPLVTAASLEAGLPCVFVRNQKKDYGTAKLVEGTLNANERVILIEDVATTGGQALEAMNALKLAGAVIIGIVVTIDREEGARENLAQIGVPYEVLFTKRELGITDE